MKLVNEGESFEITYDGIDYSVPEGEMEINNDFLGNHIIDTARKWGFPVKKLATEKIAIKKVIEPTIKTAPATKSEPVTDKKEEPRKTVSNNSKAIKDLEESL